MIRQAAARAAMGDPAPDPDPGPSRPPKKSARERMEDALADPGMTDEKFAEQFPGFTSMAEGREAVASAKAQ